MGYYCTVPQCTSLAGKTKNVKFHRFPRDVSMADRWNAILRRGKPYTKYSKVCSLHFTQSDYNVTTMGKNKGQWKTLSKDAVPSQNLPKLNPDGTVMIIRKSRTIKYKDSQTPTKKEIDVNCDKIVAAWPLSVPHTPAPTHLTDNETNNIAYKLQNALASNLLSQLPLSLKPKKQDAIMQTDPVDEEDPPTNTSSDGSDLSYNSDTIEPYTVPESNMMPKDYTKSQDYVPQTNEEYNKEAEKYALERKPNYEKTLADFQKSRCVPYEKVPDVYQGEYFEGKYPFQYGPDDAQVLRSQQHNLQMLQQREAERGYFNEDHVKQEIDLNQDEDKYPSNPYDRKVLPVTYEGRSGDDLKQYYDAPVKIEPGSNTGCDGAMQTDSNHFYQEPSHIENSGPYYNVDMSRPGPELLIAKQNALAAHTQLWQNTMKRPFFYSETPHYNGTQLLHTRYEFQDLTRILNQ